MEFTTGQLRQPSFQIMWCIGMPKQILLPKSNQIFGWNRWADKRMGLTVSLVNTKVYKFKKEDWLQMYD